MMESGVFDPRWTARLAPLSFHPRGPAEGPRVGRHESHRRGRAGDFLDRRAYAPGDDRRRIDWTVFARTDRWTVREEREDTNLRASLLLDVSPSMTFSADGRGTKLRYGAGLLAALAFVLHHGREAAGVGFFDRALLSFQTPQTGNDVLSRLFAQLQHPPTGAPGCFQDSFREFRSRWRGRGAVVVVSDFLGPLDDILSGFRLLCAGGLDVSALQVLDPVELDLAFQGNRRFQDLETGDLIRGDPAVMAESYARIMAARQSALSRGMAALGVDYQRFITKQPVDEAVATFLHRRAAR
ncbi:MAG: DUF58 domain-containing protein [Elusimicrobia bacterium]|nr:DUF58 domain-containing protein [Elusimicrobiota bacterium]